MSDTSTPMLMSAKAEQEIIRTLKSLIPDFDDKDAEIIISAFRLELSAAEARGCAKAVIVYKCVGCGKLIDARRVITIINVEGKEEYREHATDLNRFDRCGPVSSDIADTLVAAEARGDAKGYARGVDDGVKASAEISAVMEAATLFKIATDEFHEHRYGNSSKKILSCCDCRMLGVSKCLNGGKELNAKTIVARKNLFAALEEIQK